MTVEEHVPLAPLTTFRIGGPARFFLRARTVEELKQAFDFAQAEHQRVLVLGGGSNVLVSDAGFDGLVIKVEIPGVAQEGTTLTAGAGESWDALVERAVRAGLWGVENLSGIPGTVGAAPVQNIGAYGCELADALAWVEALDTHTGALMRLQGDACGFGYRTSMFKHNAGRYVIVRVALTLTPHGTPNSSYKDLADIGRFNLPEIRQKVLEVRKAKFPDLAVEGTAGSFFLNPTVSAEKARALAAHYPGLPQFAAEGGVKLSLAWLLDNALGLKGAAVGGARLYERQPLVIAAARNATAEDVRELASLVKNSVQKNLGISIEEEVKVI